MSASIDRTVSKVPAVTLGFWIAKVLATTLGETGGDAVTMTLGLGYLVGTLILEPIYVFDLHFLVTRLHYLRKTRLR